MHVKFKLCVNVMARVVQHVGKFDFLFLTISVPFGCANVHARVSYAEYISYDD